MEGGRRSASQELLLVLRDRLHIAAAPGVYSTSMRVRSKVDAGSNSILILAYVVPWEECWNTCIPGREGGPLSHVGST